MNARELMFGIGDVIATHQLLRYTRPEENEVRIITGMTMAGLGYAFGPELTKKLKETKDVELGELSKEKVIYAAGGTALGAIAGHLLGNDIHERVQEKEKRNGSLGKRIHAAIGTPTKKQPGGLLTVAAAGYLGYSLFVEDHNEEFHERQYWGLGAGTVGFLWGPEVIHKVQEIIIPEHVKDDALMVYQRGAAAFGSLVGLGAGMYAAGKRPLKKVVEAR